MVHYIVYRYNFKQLPTYHIYQTSRGYSLPPTLNQTTNKDIKLTWFHSNIIQALLDTFPCPGMAIYHCFWMWYSGLFSAHVTKLPYK